MISLFSDAVQGERPCRQMNLKVCNFDILYALKQVSSVQLFLLCTLARERKEHLFGNILRCYYLYNIIFVQE